MTAQTKGVDVLAVMDEFVVVVGDEFGNDPAVRLREARAAIAELIEACGPLLKMEVLTSSGRMQGDHLAVITGKTITGIVDALAHIGGAK